MAPALLSSLQVRPVTPKRWPDLERLFGERGACAGCWCMYWRVRRSVWEKQKSAGTKRAMKKLVASGDVPGLIAYAGREPVGWISLGPRETFPVLGNSRVLAPVDAQPVWSVVCFFIARPYRRAGVSVKLLEAATEYARKRGAKRVEGYPVDPRKGKMPDAFAWTGLPSAFAKVGFEEVARRSPTRPIMRKQV
jgi:GNAT superfamily N-acetyltransferase